MHEMKVEWYSLTFALLVDSITGIIYINTTCGQDLSGRVGYVHEGRDHMTMYPWIGYMFYSNPTENLFSIPVVLITRQLVMGSAADLDKYPRLEIRARSRVVLGNSCRGQSIPILEYTYHRDYLSKTYSSLALIQLNTTLLRKPLNPICAPPAVQMFDTSQVYAIRLSETCTNPYIRVYRMEFVGLQDCEVFYRRTELDMEKMWPTHTTCARAMSGHKCVWPAGTVLLMKDGDRWRLLGFGVLGPGCASPARFLDYGRYRRWVWRSVRNIGQPALTRIAPDYLVLRRSLSGLQRHGNCEPEEIKAEIFSERSKLAPPGDLERRIRYNLTLYANMEYSCITIEAVFASKVPRPFRPMIFLRRWCTRPYPLCYDAQLLEVDLYIEIYFIQSVELIIYVYGKEIKFVDTKRFMNYENHKWDMEQTSTEPVPTTPYDPYADV